MQMNPLEALAASASNTSSSSAGTTSTASSLGSDLNGDDFMTLLVAQLQSQDPLDPMDPTQMVGQLVQFNTLEQIIQIRQDIEAMASSQATTSAPVAGKSK